MNTEEPEDQGFSDNSDETKNIDQQITEEEEEGGLPSPDYGDGSLPDFLYVRENQDQVIVTIYAYKDPRTNRLRSISLEPSYVLREAKMIEFPIETEWTIPSKSQMDDYRSRSLRFSATARGSVRDRTMMEELLVKYHLKKVHFTTADKQRTSLDLQQGKKGGLTQQSIDLLKSLHASVLELLIIKFIDESALLL